ncbi:baseplate wedge subunit [Synechococcus phage S-SKS1]|uniref:Baseplate wedge subunit n=1 Tax=Synechococcus phage S-SKS1 TaxID=754042 RepID=M4R1Q4_9CAUD|nr:baseplate wedge subunit [Synechococcus phage S-SKS1]AGH31672.1 baseplate wedge subunit [Synechococcus phage S-SKS1]
MPFTKYTNLDFDQIKTSIKDYLRANSTFTDFDFEGSNFSVLIDTLAYNTYITAFNSNMVVNESFLDSATLRENVVSLAGNIGYVPRSRVASTAQISFNVTTSTGTPTLTLKAGIVCVGSTNDTTYTFAVPEDVTANVVDGIASFNNLDVYQGIFLTKQFQYDGSLDQRFVLNNSFIDTSTLKVYIKKTEQSGVGIEYFLSENIFDIDKNSRIFFINEVQDEKYELRFGDGLIGKKLGDEVGSDGTIITANYIITDGRDGNGASNFSFSGTLENATGGIIDPGTVTITTNQSSINGGDIEPIDSIKYYAPRLYSSQYRAVTSRDYEAIIKRIYPDTESVSVVGGEEMDPPQFGTVQISIKPKNGSFVSDFNKTQILSKLKQFTVSGINQKITDLKILYVELNSSVYYNYSQVSNSDTLKTSVTNSLQKYSESLDLNKFGGRLRYSKLQQVIDNTDTAITSNITKIIIRRDLKPVLNKFAQYELCYGNRFNVKSEGLNIKSTGFKISGETDTVYFTDVPNADLKTGTLSIVKQISDETRVVVKSAGTVDYLKGEIILGTVNITSTSLSNGLIEIQAFPESNDVVGLRDLYVSLNIPKSTINIVRDVIASGDEISGTRFVNDFYTSSYSNGNLVRK